MKLIKGRLKCPKEHCDLHLQKEKKIVYCVENLIQIHIHPHPTLVIGYLKNLDVDEIFVMFSIHGLLSSIVFGCNF